MKGQLVFLPDILDDYDRIRAFEKPGSPKYKYLSKDDAVGWALLVDEVEVEEDRELLLEAWVVPLDEGELAKVFQNHIHALQRQLKDLSEKLQRAGFQAQAQNVSQATELLQEISL